MKKILLVILLCCTLPGLMYAQEEDNARLESFMRNFARANLDTKIKVLEDAEQLDLEGLGPLYLKAVEFVIGNQILLMTDPAAQRLAILATRLIGEAGYEPAKYEIWDLFEINKDTTVRVQVLNTLGKIGKGDEEIIYKLNNFLLSQNTQFLTGGRPDNQVVAACVAALGSIGATSSFPVVFTAMSLSYSDSITSIARQSLYAIEGDLKDHLINVIRKNPIEEKLKALRMALVDDNLTDNEKGEVAESAMEVALNTTSPDATEKAQLREIRYVAARALTERNWSKATNLAIRHFDVTVMEYDRGIARKTDFLESIACLGAMATHEAAVRLNLYLDLLNTYKEQDRPVDGQIVLAVINNLGKLGDKVAMDNLLFVGYLNYSQTVQKAAREAINNLKSN